MVPDTSQMPVPVETLAPEMTVMDAVYNPIRTKLLIEAERIGCKTVDGVSMFVYQGARQFTLWTGKSAPVPAMRKAVLEALGKAPAPDRSVRSHRDPASKNGSSP
jgi:shikimate dehydrogenase